MIKPTVDKSKKQQYSLESALFQITECAVKTESMRDYAIELHAIILRLMYAENFFVAVYEQNQSLVDFIYIVDEFNSEIDVMLSEEELRRTLTGHMLRTGEIQHLSSHDIQRLTDDNMVDNVGEDCNDWLGVPLKYNDEILGGIVVQSYKDDIVYSEKDKEILQFVARQIALVFKNKLGEKALIKVNEELEKRVLKRTDELKKINAELAIEIQERQKGEAVQYALFRISELVSTSSSLDDFFQSVHEIISQLMPAKNEYVALLSENKEQVEFLYFSDEHDPFPGKREFDLSKKQVGLTEQILQSGKSILYTRNSHDPDSATGVNCASYLGVPLINKNEIFGVLAVQSYQEDMLYDNKDKEILTTIGQQVAMAILRKKDAESLFHAHENLEKRVRMRTSELEKTIKKRKVVEKKLAHESLHDTLTGLPNRLHLFNRLNKTVGKKNSEKESMLALLFLDLDRFKLINDSLGHHIGDLFLIEIANRLKKCLRADDMVARLGGDEFCILMPSIPGENIALQLASRILKELKKPVVVAKNSLMTSASIGVRLAMQTEKSAELIMSDADAAMYQAKHQGKNRFCFFDADIKKLVTGRMKMEGDLREAISQQQFYLVYQPLVNFRTNKVVGFEALIRWKHPETGIISPIQFIPVAEETGLIVEIGEMVIRMACEALVEFKRNPVLKDLYLNVNVSSIQILSRTLDDFIRKNLTQFQLEADKLNVEITESILIDDYKAALSFVRELKAMGIKIYLDDFGTGFSSLSYLHKFPFDAIKLDRSFIIALDESSNNEAIVDSIGQLAKNLGIKIVAEGIETIKQLNTIKSMDYTVAQGYYFSKPIDYNEIDHYMESAELALN